MVGIKYIWRKFLQGASLDHCATEVSIKNKKNLKAFSVLGIVMMSLGTVFGWIMSDVFTFNSEFIILLIYFIVMYGAVTILEEHIKRPTLAFYLWQIPLMAMGTIIGTFADPSEPSITIMVFLCVLPIFILDKPWRVIAFVLSNAVVYTVCCYIAKESNLFIADMIDLVLFTTLSVGVTCLTLKDRIDNVEYAMKMRNRAEIDGLTNLYNRHAGEERINRLLDDGEGGMFILIDFDNFKNINDNYGHAKGDLALETLAHCLKRSFRERDIIMRLGGDEFVVFAPQIKSREAGSKCINRMIHQIRTMTVTGMPNYNFSVSVGIALWNSRCSQTFEMLYKESDKALYQAKKKGKDGYCFSGENI